MQPGPARAKPFDRVSPSKTAKLLSPNEIRTAIEAFLATAREPVLIEPGEDPMPVTPGGHAFEERRGRLTLECWEEHRNLVRKISGIRRQVRGRLDLETERFAGRKGELLLLDRAHPGQREAARRGNRLKYREQFRLSLLRQFPDWRIAELSTEPDLEHSLSPVYPRALLRKGTQAIAAIGAAEDTLDVDGVLSFGLIWLDYLRRREKGLGIGGLVLFVPIGQENTTCHRVRHLNPQAVRCAVFVHGAGIEEEAVDPAAYTNLSTRLDPFRRALPVAIAGGMEKFSDWATRIAAQPFVDRSERPDGSVRFSVRGIEFACAEGGQLRFGLEPTGRGTQDTSGSRAAWQIAISDRHIAEIEAIAAGLARMRRAEAADAGNPLYRSRSEAWLESQIRRHISTIDATLLPSPIYPQAPAVAGGRRGVLDLLAVDERGRLAVIEVKADQDIHLPLQALDYWMRVTWHLQRGEFTEAGYFPSIELQEQTPRLLLVAPALEFHPTTATILRYLASNIEVERIGVGIEWRHELRVMFRSARHA